MTPQTGKLRLLFRKTWPRYVTEAVVIVTSVLTAFALDSWRERRSREAEEIAILATALEETERDLADIDFNVARHAQAITSLDLVLAQLEANRPYHDSLAAHFHNAFNMPRFVHSTSAFETMQSQGMDIVSNEPLRNRLIRVYGATYANYLTAEAELASEITYGLRTIAPGRFREGYRFTDVGRSYAGRMTPLAFDRLRRDQEFLYFMRTLRNRTDVFVNFHYRNLRSESQQLRDDLTTEITRRAH